VESIFDSLTTPDYQKLVRFIVDCDFCAAAKSKLDNLWIRLDTLCPYEIDLVSLGHDVDWLVATLCKWIFRRC
jgi:hypothetical protein